MTASAINVARLLRWIAGESKACVTRSLLQRLFAAAARSKAKEFATRIACMVNTIVFIKALRLKMTLPRAYGVLASAQAEPARGCPRKNRTISADASGPVASV